MVADKLTCPKCGGQNVDEFQRAYWFLCRDCGYNSMPDSDREKAKFNFLTGYDHHERKVNPDD